MVDLKIESINAKKISIPTFVASMAAFISVFQVYFANIGGTWYPLSILLCLSSVICAGHIRYYQNISLLLLIHLIFVMLSVFWSPSPGAWANQLLYGYLFFMGLFVGQSSRVHGDIVLKAFLIGALLNAILVCIFRLFPEIESSYFTSGLINIVKNPDRVAGLAIYRPNVLDVDKSGGVFDNANTGAAFSLTAYGVLIYLSKGLSKVEVTFAKILIILAILLSGSKSAVIILIAGWFGLRVLGSYILSGRKFRFIIILYCLLAIYLIYLSYDMLYSLLGATDFGAETIDTYAYRQRLMEFAVSQFYVHPLEGLGFGGWYQELARYSGQFQGEVYWPPHNSIIQSWADSGIIPALTMVAILFRISGNLILKMREKSNFVAASGALFSLICCALMSMGDPMPLFGPQNSAFALGILVSAVTRRGTNLEIRS